MTTAIPTMTAQRSGEEGGRRLPPGFRLALVGPLPPPSGGMANQTRQLERLWRAEGMDVELIRTNRPYLPRWIERVRGVRAAFRLLPYVAALWRAAGRSSVMHVMANSGWSWHLFAAPAIVIGRLRSVPVVVNYRGGQAAGFVDRQYRLVGPVLKRADLLVVPSGFLKAVFGERGFSAEIVPNIIDVNRFRPRASDQGTRDVPRILVARNLEPLYDVASALRAFSLIVRRYPHAELVIAGSGPERSSLEALARSLAIAEQVRFTGRVDNDRMTELYQQADILLNTSLVDNMPISLLEAMASGVPIVSTDVGGIPHMVEDGVTGILVAPRNPEATANALLRLLDDPVRMRRLREKALDAVQAYHWDNVRVQWISVYGKLAKEAAHVAA